MMNLKVKTPNKTTEYSRVYNRDVIVLTEIYGDKILYPSGSSIFLNAVYTHKNKLYANYLGNGETALKCFEMIFDVDLFKSQTDFDYIINHIFFDTERYQNKN